MNKTETETDILSSLDYEPICETVYWRYSTKQVRPGSECELPAEFLVKFHNIVNCKEETKLMCKKHMIEVTNDSCKNCGLEGRLIAATPIK